MGEQVEPNQTESAEPIVAKHPNLRGVIRDAVAPKTEHTHSKEKSPKKYASVTFGHWYRDFDRDQLLTYYFALKGGLVDPSATIQFTSDIQAESLADPTQLVIEGFGPTTEGFDTKKGNFSNGEKDIPAASVFFQSHSRILTDPSNPLKTPLLDLNNWFKAEESNLPQAEKDGLKGKLSTLTVKAMKLITPLFYALKHEHPDVSEATILLKKCVEMLDLVIEGKKSEELEQTFQSELEQSERARSSDTSALRERAKDERFLKSATTMNGFKLAYFDVRGLDIKSDAFSVVSEQMDAQIVMLISDEHNNENEIIGTKYLIKVPKSQQAFAETNKIDVHAILADRLDISESLYGKGYAFASQKHFGGHEGAGGVVGSAQGLGSALDAEALWHSLQRFFDVRRYSKTQFKQEAQNLATLIGTDQYAPEILQPPANEMSLAEWHITIRVPTDDNSGEEVVVTLSEAELALYTQFLKPNDVSFNRSFLRKKSLTNEPPEVIQARKQQANEYLNTYLGTESAPRLLSVIDAINPATVEQLDIDQQLSLLTAIAKDPTALDQIWNPKNKIFRITLYVPEWIANDPTVYQQEKYKYTSVPKKIDTHLIKSILSNPNFNAQPELQIAFGNTLVDILTSEIYTSSHTDEDLTADTIFGRFITFLESTKLDESITTEWLEKIQALYKPDHRLWKEKVLDNLRIEPEDPSSLKEFLDTQEQITVLVEIGRKIMPQLISQELLTTDQIGVEGGLASHIVMEGTFDTENNDEDTIAQRITDRLIELHAQNPNKPLYIMRGGFSNILIEELTKKLILFTPNSLPDKVYFYNYDVKSSKFIARKFL